MGATHFREIQKLERSSYVLIPRVMMTSEQEGVKPFKYQIYPEYETPSQQHENGQIAYFWVITGLPRSYYNTSPP